MRFVGIPKKKVLSPTTVASLSMWNSIDAYLSLLSLHLEGSRGPPVDSRWWVKDHTNFGSAVIRIAFSGGKKGQEFEVHVIRRHYLVLWAT